MSAAIGSASELAPIPVPSSVDELLDRARRRGLELTAADPDVDPTGLDFIVAHAQDRSGVRWIVRAPRRADVVESARCEAKVLRLVAPRLGVPVPDWRIHHDDVIAYPRLEGIPAVTLEGGAPKWNVIDPKSPSDVFVDSLARVLAALQGISVDEARAAGARVTSIDEVRETFARALEVAREPLAPSDALLSRWKRWLEGDTWPAHVAMVHGDLHPGHMLLDPSGQIAGILDWTEARVTDPSIDFAMFAGCFGKEPFEAFVRRFAELGGQTWPRMMEHSLERWAAFPALVAEWAVRFNNDGVLEHARGLVAGLVAAP
jgi:aminoglycoside phosphotransferase (APT) family kinase protein